MRNFFIYSFIVCIVYLSCASSSSTENPFKIPTAIRDSACTSCMPWYIDSFPKMGDDSVLGMWAEYTTMPDAYQAEQIGATHEREEVYIYI